MRREVIKAPGGVGGRADLVSCFAGHLDNDDDVDDDVEDDDDVADDVM